MRKHIPLVFCSMSICLAFFFTGMPTHTRAAHADSACSSAVSNAFGAVTGLSYAMSITAAAGVKGAIGANPVAWLDCSSEKPHYQATTASASVGIPGSSSLSLAHIGHCDDQVTVTRNDATGLKIEEESIIGNISLFGGLVQIAGIHTGSETEATATGTKSTNTSQFIGVTILGQTFSIKPTPNFGVNIPGIGKILFNEEVTTTDPNDPNMSDISVYAIDVQVLEPNLFLPVGARMVLGHTESRFVRTLPDQVVSASGFGFDVYASALLADAASGPWSQVHMFDDTGNVDGGLAAVSLPGIGTIGAMHSGLTQVKTSYTTSANCVESIAKLNVFNGTFDTGLLSVEAHASIKNGVPSAWGAAGLGHASVGGQALNTSPPPNFGVDIPGLGKLMVNEQTITKTENSIKITNNLLDLDVLDPHNKLLLPVGVHILIGHCEAYAGTTTGGSATAPTPTPTSISAATATPTETPATTPTATATEAPISTPATTPTAPSPGNGLDLKITVSGGTITAGESALLSLHVTNTTASSISADQPITVTFTVPDGFGVKLPPQKAWQMTTDSNTGNMVATYVGAYPIAPGASLPPILLVGSPTSTALLQVSATLTLADLATPITSILPVQPSDCPCNAKAFSV